MHYLVEAATADVPASRTWDIGGPDVFEYGDMMQIYAQVAGLRRRRMFVLPLLTPALASLWVGLVTPVPSGMARPLVESLQSDAVMNDHDIDRVIATPAGGLTPYRRAVALALNHVAGRDFTKRSIDAEVSAPSDLLASDPDWAGPTVYSDVRTAPSFTSPDDLWKVVENAGNSDRWYSFPIGWPTRRRATRWMVQEREPGTLLRMRTDARAPVHAWLELVASPQGAHSCYRQSARVLPRGLAGRLYWHVLKPLNWLALRRMANGIVAPSDE